MLPLILSTTITATLTGWGASKLRQFKLNQIIRKEGPEEHLKKTGTPTMGGLFVVPTGLIIGNLINLNSSINNELLGISFLIIAYMIIGFIDDWSSLTRGRNTGLTVKQKISLQVISASVFIYWGISNGIIEPKVSMFFEKSIDFGIFFFPLALFVLIAESNATNLTDGLDGLASGCGAIVFTGLSIELILRGSNDNYAMASFCIAMAGAWLGFLIHNRKPAKLFMGDTGSLAMGASLGGLALVSNTLWALFIMGGIFLIESLSVIIQVLGFKVSKKITGKGVRIFLMAPLHHHYELKGKGEIEIVNIFWFSTIILVIIGILLRTSY